MRTDKEIIQFVYDKLMVQGRKSYDGTTCKYRSLDGHARCAVGWLIPDENYKPEFECDVVHISKNYGVTALLRRLGYSESKLDLLLKLQKMHDLGPLDETFRTYLHTRFRKEFPDVELKGVEHYEVCI